MAKHPDYPGVSSYIDRHGTTRYKFRLAGLRPATIPGQPHTPQFDAAYQAAIEGRPFKPRPAAIPMPGAMRPQSLTHAWRKVQETAKWRKLDIQSQQIYSLYIEEFLNQPLDKTNRVGDGPCADFRPRHVAAALDAWSATPHKAKTLLVVLRKLMKVAIVQEWIDHDPTYGIDRPDTASEGKRAWPSHVCAQYELRWPIGTPARTAYEIAKWLGTRRSDVASIRWDHLVTEIVEGKPVQGFRFVQYKGRNRRNAFAKFHPISSMLAEALAPLDRTTGTVLVQANGEAYKIKSMTAMMWHWRKAAGIPSGYSFHGLRHAMGAMLADSDASDVQTQDVLGHATISEQNKYKKERNQARSATKGIEAVERLHLRLVRG